MAKNTEMRGIPHTPGTDVTTVAVEHPLTGESHTIYVPADHDGSRIRVEFPEVRGEDGEIVVESAGTYTDGWDPAERALTGARPVVPCGNCGEPQVLTSDRFACSACGSVNQIELKASGDAGTGDSSQSGD